MPMYLSKAVELWVKAIGKAEAIRRLVLRGVSVTTADKICSSRYHSKPGRLLSMVLISEMAADGVQVDMAS